MKTGDVVRQRRRTSAQSRLKTTQLANAPFDVASASPNALVRIDEAARYLRYEGKRAAAMCAKFLRFHNVKLLPRGRRLLVRRADLDLALNGGDGHEAEAVKGQVAQEIARRVLHRSPR